jgi:hypothetical protein
MFRDQHVISGYLNRIDERTGRTSSDLIAMPWKGELSSPHLGAVSFWTGWKHDYGFGPGSRHGFIHIIKQ